MEVARGNSNVHSRFDKPHDDDDDDDDDDSLSRVENPTIRNASIQRYDKTK